MENIKQSWDDLVSGERSTKYYHIYYYKLAIVHGCNVKHIKKRC